MGHVFNYSLEDDRAGIICDSSCRDNTTVYSHKKAGSASSVSRPSGERMRRISYRGTSCDAVFRPGIKVPGKVLDDGASLTSALRPASALRVCGLWPRTRFWALVRRLNSGPSRQGRRAAQLW